MTSAAVSSAQPSAVDEQPAMPATKPTRDDGHPAVAVHRAAGRERGQRAGGEEDRRAEPEDPLDAGDEDERDRRRPRRRAGTCPRATSAPRRAGSCCGGPGSGPPRDPIPARDDSRAERAAPPCDGWRTYGPPSARIREPADRDDAAAARRAREERRAGCDLAARRRAVRRRACPDASARGSRAGRRPRARARPATGARSSRRLGRPAPVSWRSEVNGMPGDACAAVAGRLADEQDPRSAPLAAGSARAARAGARSPRTG